MATTASLGSRAGAGDGPGSRWEPRLVSSVPGRRRWELDALLGRTEPCRRLEDRLLANPGVRRVHAQPLSGRILLYHETSVDGDELDELLTREVAGLAPPGLVGGDGASIDPRVLVPPARLSPEGRPSTALVAGGAAVLAWSVLAWPLARLAAVALVTGVVLTRSWRRARRRAVSSGQRHPLRLILGSRRARLWRPVLYSFSSQVLDLVPTVLTGAVAVVLLAGESGVLKGLGLATPASQLTFLVAGIAVSSAAMSATSRAAASRWNDVGGEVEHDWRAALYAHVQRVELAQLEARDPTRLAAVLDDDVAELGRLFSAQGDYLVRLIAGFGLLVATFALVAPSMAWIAFLPVPLLAWRSFRHHEQAALDGASSADAAARLRTRLRGNMEASATVKSYGAEDHEAARIEALSAGSCEATAVVAARSSSYAESIRLGTIASLVGTMLAGGLKVASGTLAFEAFTLLVGLPQVVLWQLPRLGSAVDQYHRTLGALDRVLELRGLPAEELGSGAPLSTTEVRGELVLDRVSFSYEDRGTLFEDLSLRIEPGSTTGIVGPSGTGKTTVAKLLLRFREPASGHVRLDGRDLRVLRVDDLRRHVALVTQEPYIFEGTVEENIRYGSFDAAPARVIDAARMASVDSFVSELPDGYHTGVGERAVSLSGGQRQRIALARAILKDASILILDEATSAVDNETEASIQRALAAMTEGRTVIVIAHRLSTLRHADVIHVLGTSGTVVESGSHEDLLARGGDYASLWAHQLGEAVP